LDIEMTVDTVAESEITDVFQATDSVEEISVIDSENNVKSLDFNTYLIGVLLAEVPASFETEALKAQAVVARTYALRAITQHSKHEGADVCTDSACCQGYLEQQAYLDMGGTNEKINKMKQAVNETDDLVLTYDAQLIQATYFSASGGSTEDAVAVWGTDVPYLRATQSPGEEHATYHTDEVVYPLETFQNLLSLDKSIQPEALLGPVTYTAGGGVNTMYLGGKQFTGTQLRSLLNLRSTDFEMKITGAGVAITTHGYGHRVGMSQYGADAIEKDGENYQQILSHYYAGTKLQKWID